MTQTATQNPPFRSPYVPPAPKRESLISRIVNSRIVNTLIEGLSTMFDFLAIVLKVLLGLLAVAAIIMLGAVLFAFPVMWLWNYTIPHLFHGVPELDFWHAWALGALCGMLFKSSSSSSSSSKS